ncbi:xanthine dehydrogenase family protein molybdopterin-binding subunit [Sphingomonas sp. 1P06PA]|uniref:xanthine dehydrogenase family protein molybdopterin-binding subunit n=1 Tax=Sphingomonas sp. 1P06PA TaxID=554121 RepID=UPI0039A59F20
MSDTNTLKMDDAVAPAALERGDGPLGTAVDRIEGPLKVSGSATYAHEYRADRMAYGFIVTATIGKGKVDRFDTVDAEAAPGVIAVIDAGKATPHDGSNFGEAAAGTGNREISHFGQPLLLVVADTFEQARAGAALVRVHYKPDADGRFDLAAVRDKAVIPNPMMGLPDHRKGDFDDAFEKAPVRIDSDYTTPTQIHCAMEPHAALAEWRDDEIVVHASYQMMDSVRKQLAKQLSISADKVRLHSPYVGGGFGSKLGLNPETMFAAWAARELKRPVKVALTRQQLFTMAGRRTDSIQRVRLGAEADGRLVAIGHDALVSNRSAEPFYEPVCISTVNLYAAENRRISHRIAATDLMVAVSMRAPGEAIGQLALESAMDELAHEIGVDPVDLRRINEPDGDPQTEKPFSSRGLLACLDDGARRFGWQTRNPVPAQVRDGDWLVGMGMACLARTNYLQQSQAKVRIERDGTVTIETDMTDIGTGSYTILAQIAAETLSLPVASIKVVLGDTALPVSAGSGGSWGAASAGSSVYLACEQLLKTLAERAGADADAPVARDGALIVGNSARPFVDLLQGEALEADGVIKPGKTSKSHSQAAFGAVFCEVGVHVATGEVRVRRMIGSFAAGRILNPKTAGSQCIGGMVWGIGGALHEDAVIDTRHGHITNGDLGEYHVPVHADIPAIEAHFIDERDPLANPLGAKGIGELGICGSGAAVANAVFNATGVRVRDFPITLDKLLAGLPDL